MNLPKLGHKIKQKRRAMGISQKQLAQQCDVSPAYISMIEADKRIIGGALMKKIIAILDLEFSDFSSDAVMRQHDTLDALRHDHLFKELDLSDYQHLFTDKDDWAQALIKLYRAYQDACGQRDILYYRLQNDPKLLSMMHEIYTQITAIRSAAEILDNTPNITHEYQQKFMQNITAQSQALSNSARDMFTIIEGNGHIQQHYSPDQERDDFLIKHQYYFPILEEYALELREKIKLPQYNPLVLLQKYCHDHQISYGDNMSKLQIACAIIADEYDTKISNISHDPLLTSDDARLKTKQALIRYMAGALLLPYDVFYNSALKYQYDIDRLMQLFDASFEQICHRLVSLRRARKSGIAFCFLRCDIAGNITKKFPLPNMPLPNYGSACAKWNIYHGFLHLNHTHAQWTEIDDQQFLFIARATSYPNDYYGDYPRLSSVMIGCTRQHGEQTIYGRNINYKSDDMMVKAGVSCYTCRLENCAHRAFPYMFGH